MKFTIFEAIFRILSYLVSHTEMNLSQFEIAQFLETNYSFVKLVLLLLKLTLKFISVYVSPLIKFATTLLGLISAFRKNKSKGEDNDENKNENNKKN